MPRRKTRHITGIKGKVAGIDYTVVWRLTECGRPGCDQILKIQEDDWDDEFSVSCPKCGYQNDVELVLAAPRWKYCRVCQQLQPLENFHRHKPMGSWAKAGRQFECKTCKNQKINPFLNPRRTPDQFREASERRRLYGLLANETKINGGEVYRRFGGKCFRCKRDLRRTPKGAEGYRLDHTLPAWLLWPLAAGPTLLCDDCNNAKHGRWPSEFYSESELRSLAVLSGITYGVLKGGPRLNPEAVERLKTGVDEFLARWIKYPEEIKKVRRLVLEMEGVDLYELAKTVPDFLRG